MSAANLAPDFVPCDRPFIIGRELDYSFHETKNFIAGEGGVPVVNDPVFMDRAQQVADKGTNRAQFRLGAVDKYSWVDLGSSYYPSEMIAEIDANCDGG